MKRRDFNRSLLLGAGEISLLAASAQVGAASLWHHRKQGKTGSLSIRVGSTVEITRARERCWFPSLYRFPDKTLIATMSMHSDTVHPQEGFREAYCVSRDGGATWSQRYGVETVRGVWAEVPSPDGSLWGVSGHIVGTRDDQNFLFVRSQISARTASDGQPVTVDQRKDVVLHMSEPTLGLMFTGSILPSRDGSLVACVYSRSKAAPEFYRLAIAHSSDNGNSWREGTIIASVGKDSQPPPGMGKDGPCEAGLVRLRDGRLFVVFRTGSDGDLGTAWSSDEGRTWTDPALIPFKGVEPRVRLLSNGVLALSTGRPGPVNMLFSIDGTGQSWSHQTDIFTAMSTRYTEFLELAPGKLFLVYDSVPHGWKEIPDSDAKAENAIYGTWVEVELG